VIRLFNVYYPVRTLILLVGEALIVWTSFLLGTVLISFFIGITFLAHVFGLVPAEQETINSQLARRVFGGGSLLYYVVQAMTMLILVLAANTSFVWLPANEGTFWGGTLDDLQKWLIKRQHTPQAAQKPQPVGTPPQAR